ncbi:MAG: biopolymer transport protein ExbB [Cryomorphaceae bacterium]|jgi:biopolymer transport protein ExbB
MRVKRFINLLVICFCAGSSPVLKAQSEIDFEGIKKDLNASTKKLTEYRESVTVEKVELSKKLTSTQAELTQKRRKARLAAMGNADRKIVLAKLTGKASAKRREVMYLGSQLGEFYNKIKRSMYKGEVFNSDYKPQDDSLIERMKALEAGIDRLEMMMGGAVVDAEVADEDGKIQQGKLVSFGPAAWFANGSGDVTGAVVVDKASRNARLIDTGNPEISKLIAGEEVSLDVDLTGGKARALASISNTPLDLLSKGGAWIWPIIVIALISLVCAILKFFQLSKIKNPRGGWVAELLEYVREGDIGAAQNVCIEARHPIGVVMKNALSGFHKGADVVEEIVYEQMIDVQSKLQKWLPFIAITAAIAPLLGLLGTVSGMISTFSALSVVGTGDPKLLSGGISEALVTTLFGLVVAIPALILHSLLSRRSQGIIQTTEKIGLTVVNCIRKK